MSAIVQASTRSIFSGPLVLVLLSCLGAMWSLAFEPVGWAGIQILVLAGVGAVLQALHPVSGRSALRNWFKSAWFMAWVLFSVGVAWLYISLHEFGGVPAPLAMLAVLALAAYMALYPALAFAAQLFFLQALAGRRRTLLLESLLFGALWALSEFLRAWVLTGFPWLSSGEAWLDTPLAGWYPLVGSYGVAFLVASVAWMASRVLFDLLVRVEPLHTELWARLQSHLALLSGFVLLVGLGGSMLLRHDWGIRAAKSVTVHIAQPNVSQTIKFDPEHITQNFIDTVFLGRRAAEPSSPGDWLLLPETALPVIWQEAPVQWRDAFAGMAYEYQVQVVMGVALQEGDVYTNSVIALPPETHTAPDMPAQRYDKRHLVPFGEFIPWGFRWFVDFMNMPMGDFNRGSGAPSPFHLNGLKLLPNVCYEDVFSHEFASLVGSARQEPNVLFNVSNLAWFGGSWALEQHGQMSRVRAAETRKPMLRATNTGISGAIDAQGQWVLKMPVNQRTSASVSITGTEGLTPYVRWGLALTCGLILLLLVFAFALTKPANVQ
jgi:apolipoprotein N-acyltransferase